MGSYYQMGMIQGKKWEQDDETFSFVQSMTKDSDARTARRGLEKVAPFLLEELQGLADGLGMSRDTIIRMYSGYDVSFPSMGCTVFANNNFYVRNYDFSPVLYDARFVFSRPNNGYASAGFSEQVVGRLDGMNEKGLVVGLHLVNEKQCQSG